MADKSITNEIIQSLLEKKGFKETLKENDGYMKWLKTFTFEQHGAISTDCIPDYPKKDRLNVKHLASLFEMIDEYAQENYSYPEKNEFGLVYSIHYGEDAYRVGFDAGQGCSFYCIKLSKPDKNSMDFEQIRRTVKMASAQIIDEKLEQLSSIIEQLESEEVPLPAIAQTVETTIHKIKEKKKNS